jgi:hypothetical protein
MLPKAKKPVFSLRAFNSEDNLMNFSERHQRTSLGLVRFQLPFYSAVT